LQIATIGLGIEVRLLRSNESANMNMTHSRRKFVGSMAAAAGEAQTAAAAPRRAFDWRCKPRLQLMPARRAPAEQ